MSYSKAEHDLCQTVYLRVVGLFAHTSSMTQSLKDIFWNDLTLRCIKWEPYFDVYEQYFASWRDRSPTLVEVGVYGGGSLEMWTKYFDPGSTIWGIDCDPKAAGYDIPGARVALGDQSDRQFWKNFLQHTPKIDLFLDDGGHRMHEQIITFECVWPHISENGIYICEDTHTSFWNEYGAVQGADTFLAYSKRTVDVLYRNHMRTDRPNSSMIGLLRDLKSVAFYDSMVVFQKGRSKFDWCEVNGIS